MTRLACKTPCALAASLIILACPAAHASCGSSFCTLLNDRFALGTWEHVGWSADVRLESVTQDRLRTGTRMISAAQVTGEEAVERHTRTGTHDAVYAFVQLPLYQKVNGIQLVPRASLAAGCTRSF